MYLIKETILTIIVLVLIMIACSENKYFPWPNMAAVFTLYIGAWRLGVFKVRER